MSDDALAGTTLLRSQHHIAHTEHYQKHLHLHQHQHQRQHQKLHKRQEENQGDTIPGSVDVVVTQVIATLSVIQEIEVDSNGVTFSNLLVPATMDPYPTLTDDSRTATEGEAPSSTVNTPTSNALSNPSGQLSPSSSPSQGAISAPTSPPSISSNFSSLGISSNSTILISSSNLFLHNTLSNSKSSTSSELSHTSLSHLTSSSSFTASSSFTTSDHYRTVSTSSYNAPNFSPHPTSTGYGAFGTAGGIGSGAGTGSASGATSSSTGTSGNPSGSSSEPATPTPVIIGSVVSSVAGAAVVFLAFLFIWKWRKRNRNMLLLASGPPGDTLDTITGGDPFQSSGGMVERSSFINAVPAALAGLTGYKRFSQKTERTVSSSAGSERGFYRVSGMKLPSVLQSGGDGYGGGLGHLNENTLGGSSFYRDSQGFYGGSGSPSIPPVGMPTERDSGTPVMRPSPARTPVTEHGPFTSVPPPLDPPTRPDGLRRSQPSRDGSHASKFIEEV